jgi:hypothetical protein
VRFTEQEYEDMMKRKGMKAPAPPTLAEVGEKYGLTAKKESIRLVLPFKLPTWNKLLAMDHWQRAKVRNWIKERVLECIQSGVEWQTPTGLVRKLSLTDLCLAEYLSMMEPNSSKKLRLHKKLAKQKKP